MSRKKTGRKEVEVEPRQAPQLYLLAPAATRAADILPALQAALAGGAVAAVLLSLDRADPREAMAELKALAAPIQAHGAAALALADPALVARAGLDGVHLSYDEDALAEARQSFRAERIVGVGGLSSRDNAMAAGEMGTDYVMFGEPRRGQSGSEADRCPPFAAVVERVGWWAELFEVPVVGFSQTLDGVSALAAAGADFIALGDAVFAHPAGPAAAIAQAHTLIAASFDPGGR